MRIRLSGDFLKHKIKRPWSIGSVGAAGSWISFATFSLIASQSRSEAAFR